MLDAVEWRHEDPLGSATLVEVRPGGGHTQVRVTGRHRDSASLLYGMFAIAATVASVIAGTELQAPILAELGAITGLWGAAYLGARSLWGRIAGKTERRLRTLTDAIANELGGSSTDAAKPRPELPMR
ncbi:MAG: hypothetical protein JSU87_09630 [Gemmatimonadota bacterium]|nr:MAG: hypothetical protein JSU87_09630 [Gemmatimonadota bacterium]